jgi:LPS-assembly lipoprotein
MWWDEGQSPAAVRPVARGLLRAARRRVGALAALLVPLRPTESAAPPLPALPREGGGFASRLGWRDRQEHNGNPAPSRERVGRGGRESDARVGSASPQQTPVARSATRTRAAVLLAPLLVVAVALGGCVVRPLYADAPGSGTSVAVELSKIAVQPARNRVEQVLRNELIFAFTGGGEAPDAQYSLRIFLTRTEASVAVERLSEVPASYIVSLSASFVLADSTTGRTLLTGNSAADASYDFSSQRFANVRALEDAESRAAKTIAADLRIRLAAYFATHP